MIFPIIDLLDARSSEAWLLQYLHPTGLRCPRCQAEIQEARPFRKARRTQITDFRCKRCDGVYNLYTGTVFARKQLRPQQVILFLRGISKGDPVVRIAGEIGLSWRTVNKLRRNMNNGNGVKPFS